VTKKYYLFWGNGSSVYVELADDMLGIKAEQYQYWTKRHVGCVAVGTGITPAGFTIPEPQP